MVSSVSSSSYAYQQYVKPVSLPSLNETQKIAMETSTAKLGQTQFKTYTRSNYYDDRYMYTQTWSNEAFKNSTSQNLNKLKQALMGYATPTQNTIGTYSFTVSDEGISANSSPTAGGAFRDLNGNPFSQEAIAQAVQEADQDQDGLVSSLELQSRKQELQNNGDIEGAYLLDNLQDKLNIVGPDQFIQLNDNNGTLELKAYNTDRLRNQSNAPSTTTSATPQPSTVSTTVNGTSQDDTLTGVDANSEADLSIDALQAREKVLDLLRKTDLNQDGNVTKDEMKSYRSSLPSNEQNTDEIKLLDNILTEDNDRFSNFLRLAVSYGTGSSIKLSKIEKYPNSWNRFIEIYKTGQTYDPLGQLGVVSK